MKKYRAIRKGGFNMADEVQQLIKMVANLRIALNEGFKKVNKKDLLLDDILIIKHIVCF